MSYLRLYWKLVKSNFKIISIYAMIFVGVFTVYANFLESDTNSSSFEEVTPSIVLVDHDQSEFSKAFVEYLNEITDIKDVGSTIEDREDALFYGYVSNIVEIPKGFQTNLLEGKDTNLLCTARPDEASSSMLEMKINSYISTLQVYRKAYPTKSIQDLHQQTIEKVTYQTQLHMQTEKQIEDSRYMRASFFNYLSYVLMAVIIMVVGISMVKIFRTNIYKRNLMASISNNVRNLYLFLANILFGVTLWMVFISVIACLPKSDMFTIHGAMYLLNSFIFAMVCVSIGFLASCALSNVRNVDNAMNAIVNIVSLAGAFLGGAFVPQMLISGSILKLASFMPTFWYVKVNDRLAEILTFTSNEYKELFSYMGIELLFMITFVCIALLVMRNHKSQSSYLSAQEQSK